MYFQCGTFVHGDGLTNVSDTRRAVRGPRGYVKWTTRTLEVTGRLIPSSATQANIRSAIQALEAGYSLDGQSAGLYHDDGTASPHFLDSGSSISGVRVETVSFPKNERTGQYATNRDFTIVLSADYPNTAAGLIEFREELRIVGSGGPLITAVPTLTGPPQIQVTAQRTPVTASQRGQAMGLLAYPAIPAPIYPDIEIGVSREIVRGSPRWVGGRFVEFPVSWSYNFVSPVSLTGTPNRR